MSDTKELTGVEAARAKAAELKVEQEQEEKAKEESALKAKEELTQMAVIQNDAELAQLLNSNADAGAENLGGSLPLLKIFAPGKTRDLLADGTKPNEGWFFYKPTGQQFQSITCHILTISKGFYAPGMEGGDKKEVFNQMMAGIIIEEGRLTLPFVMYLTGKKLSPMWEFGKLASRYTKMKPVAFPLYSLTVKLTTKEEPNNFGSSYLPVFELVKADDGQPLINLDKDELRFLRDRLDIVQETLDNVISRKSGEQDMDSQGPGPMPFN